MNPPPTTADAGPPDVAPQKGATVDKSCSLCNRGGRQRTIQCGLCDTTVHPTCLGLSNYSYPAGVFTCAECVLFDAKLPAGRQYVSQQATEAAHTLVWLKGRRVQDSSMATYASGLHRFVSFVQSAFGLKAQEALPLAEGVGPEPRLIQLFLAWASSRYKISTIKSTLNALIDWAKSKGLPAEGVISPEIQRIVRSITREQGPEGIPVGKLGMTKELLTLILAWISKRAGHQPSMAALHHRDTCWMLIGFFGLLRRSELIALNMSDVSLHGTGEETNISVRIRRSKTDKRGEGADVAIVGITREGWNLTSLVQRYRA